MVEPQKEIPTFSIKIPAEWARSWGRTARFAEELRDNKRIMGTKCPECGIVFCPVTSDCPKCYVPTEWVEIGPRGTIEAYTICYMPSLWFPDLKPPIYYGLIKLDGADTALIHFLSDVDIDTLKNGMRVEAVFKEEGREGTINDIQHFKPV